MSRRGGMLVLYFGQPGSRTRIGHSGGPRVRSRVPPWVGDGVAPLAWRCRGACALRA